MKLKIHSVLKHGTILKYTVMVLKLVFRTLHGTQVHCKSIEFTIPYYCILNEMFIRIITPDDQRLAHPLHIPNALNSKFLLNYKS